MAVSPESSRFLFLREQAFRLSQYTKEPKKVKSEKAALCPRREASTMRRKRGKRFARLADGRRHSGFFRSRSLCEAARLSRRRFFAPHTSAFAAALKRVVPESKGRRSENRLPFRIAKLCSDLPENRSRSGLKPLYEPRVVLKNQRGVQVVRIAVSVRVARLYRLNIIVVNYAVCQRVIFSPTSIACHCASVPP